MIKIEVVAKAGKEKFTGKETVEISFNPPVCKEEFYFDDYNGWFYNRFIPNSTIYNDSGDLIRATTTPDKLLMFLGLKEQINNYNECLVELDRLAVEYDRNEWKPKY